MAYEPTVWAAGDSITSAKMNKLENAVANGGGGMMIMECTEDIDKYYAGMLADKTYEDVLGAIQQGKLVWAHMYTVEPGYGAYEMYGKVIATFEQHEELPDYVDINEVTPEFLASMNMYGVILSGVGNGMQLMAYSPNDYLMSNPPLPGDDSGR